MALYDKTNEAFFGNSVYVNVEWNEKEEDKWKFSTSSKAGTNPIMFSTSDPDIVEKDNTNLVFEMVMDVKTAEGIMEFAAGWCMIPVTDLQKNKPRTLKLDM